LPGPSAFNFYTSQGAASPPDNKENLMRLVTYRRNVLESARLGAIVDNMVVDVEYLGMIAGIDLPNDMLDFIDLGPSAVATATELLKEHQQSWPVGVAQPLQNVKLLAPI